MKAAALALILCASLAGCATQQKIDVDSYGTYGAPVASSVTTQDLSKAIAGTTEEERPVTVKATIDEVCQTKGCWMTLKSGGDVPIRVRFTPSENCAEGFYVPRNAAGREAVLVGTLKKTEIPEDWARHYAEDGGASPEEIAAIVGPQKTFELMATAVLIEGKATLDPPVQ